MAEGLAEFGFVKPPAHHIAAGGERAERIAVIALPPGYVVRALGLANLHEILARQLQSRFRTFRPGRAEIGGGQTARRAIEDDVREFLRRPADEAAGVGIGHGGGLATNGVGNAAIAVAEAGDSGAARSIDDCPAVLQMKANALTRNGHGRDGAGAMQNTRHPSRVTGSGRDRQGRRTQGVWLVV